MTRNIDPPLGLQRLAARLRDGGLEWLRRRIYQEATLPTTSIGKTAHQLLRKLLTGFRGAITPDNDAARDTLYAFYDLRIAPVTFDYVWFLCGAEIERVRRKLQNIQIVIVPGPHSDVRAETPEYEAVVSTATRRLRVFDILLPASKFLPSVAGVTLAATRQPADCLPSAAARRYPQDYSLALPCYPDPASCLRAARETGLSLATLRCPDAGLEVIDQFIAAHGRDRRLIVITLRHYKFGSPRNSDLEAWAAFARRLDERRYFPVFIPDTQQTLEPLPDSMRNLSVFPSAAWNLTLRMALYERAYLNLGVSTGPMALCWFNPKARYIMFKVVTPSVPQATIAYLQSLGLGPQQSRSFLGPFQKWLWSGSDTLPEIEAEFAAMVGRIDASEQERFGAPSAAGAHPSK